MTDYQKINVEINVNILNFIVDNLLGENSNLEEAQTAIFLNLIDKYCGIDKDGQGKTSDSEGFDEMNIDQLFKLCQANENNEKKSQISRKILPLLLSKCQEIIQSYLDEEKIYVGISFPRYYTKIHFIVKFFEAQN